MASQPRPIPATSSGAELPARFTPSVGVDLSFRGSRQKGPRPLPVARINKRCLRRKREKERERERQRVLSRRSISGCSKVQRTIPLYDCFMITRARARGFDVISERSSSKIRRDSLGPARNHFLKAGALVVISRRETMKSLPLLGPPFGERQVACGAFSRMTRKRDGTASGTFGQTRYRDRAVREG